MKVLFFVGKGGVGKSTNAALFALKLAQSGRDVLLNSIDPAHNLGDIFETALGQKPTRIYPKLMVMETDLRTWQKRYLKKTEEEFKSVYKYQDAFNLHKYFKILKYSPGLEEYAVLLALVDTIDRNKNRDVIIFDTPPTALTLKFLALPDVSLLWLNELSRFRQMILDKQKIINRIKRDREGAEVHSDLILTKLNNLERNYRNLTGILKNSTTTSVILVLNPDKLSHAESATIWKELRGLKMAVPYVILNKYEGQEQFIARVEKEFHGARVLTLEKSREEITGLKALESLPTLVNPVELLGT